jgi:hypothetical protein
VIEDVEDCLSGFQSHVPLMSLAAPLVSMCGCAVTPSLACG